MSIKIGHASIDERGKSKGGISGDQTGREVCIREWYKKAWTHVLRPKNETIANGIVKACKAACTNDNIGYDQGHRTTLYIQAAAVQFDLSKIKNKCACDCSSLVAVCVNAAGIKISKDIYTGNMVKALKTTGCFESLTDSKYLTSDQYLKAGDILICKGHAVMVLENGVSSGGTSKQENGSEYRVKIIASALNIRKGPGTNYEIVTIAHKGQIYTIVEEEKNGDTVWGKLENGEGYISLKYAEKC